MWGMALANLANEALQGWSDWERQIKPQLLAQQRAEQDRAMQLAQGQNQAMLGLVGGDPHAAYSVFGQPLLDSFQRGFGINVPTRQIEEPGPLISQDTPPSAIGPGLSSEPGPQRGPSTTRTELALPRERGLAIQLRDGRTIAVSQLRGLPKEVLEQLLPDTPTPGGARTYGELFGPNLRPEFHKIPVQRTAQGAMVMPQEFWFSRPLTPKEKRDAAEADSIEAGQAEYRRVLEATGDPVQAMRAASRFNARIFSPPMPRMQTPEEIARWREWEAAMRVYRNTDGDIEDRIRAAQAIYPEFAKGVTTPGGAAITDRVEGRTVRGTTSTVERRLEGAREVLRQLGQPTGNPVTDEPILKARAEVARLEGELRASQRQQGDYERRTQGIEANPNAWAERQIADIIGKLQSQGGTATRQELQAVFNRARVSPSARQIPPSHWRALQDAIAARP